MQKTYSSILVTGSIAYDEIMDFPKAFIDYLQPDKLHQINVSFVVDKLEKQLGGTGTNIAYNLSLLTEKPVQLLSSTGKDGDAFLKFYEENHIDTKGILVNKSVYTATGKVITDMNGNQIWGFYYGACENAKDIPLAQYGDENSLVIVSANHPLAFLHFQNEAISQKRDYLYDPGMSLSWITNEDLQNGIEHCTFLVGNDYEISAVCKRLDKTVEDFVKEGRIVITTLGEQGVNYQDKENTYHVPSCHKTKIVDPTGAGDAWRAGFIAGLIEGKSTLDSLKQANALASFAVESYGTVNHRPTREEIEERIFLL